MKLVHHESCVKLYEVFDTYKHLYIVMELMVGGDLFDRVIAEGHLTEASAARDVLSVARGLEYLHRREIIHRDLKPENLLFTNSSASATLKITDFGLSEAITSAQLKEDDFVMGTPGYIAPEVLQGDLYDVEVDLWSLGIILYILLCGYPPFLQEDVSQGLCVLDFSMEAWSAVSLEAREVVIGLLHVNPAERTTASGLLDLPWVQGIGTSADPLHQTHPECDIHVMNIAKWKKAKRLIGNELRVASSQKHKEYTAPAQQVQSLNREQVPSLNRGPSYLEKKTPALIRQKSQLHASAHPRSP